MKIKLFIIICHLLFFVPLLWTRSDNISTTGANWLNSYINPRPVAMGSAFTAVADDVNAVWYNPAGIICVEKMQATVMYRNTEEDMHFLGGAFIHSLSSNNSMAVHFNVFHLGDMDHYQLDGNIENISLGNSMVFGLSYAQLLLDNNISLGINAKYLISKLGLYSASTAAVDLGILYYKMSPFVSGKNGFSLGLAVQNLGPGLKYINESDPLPFRIKLGTAYSYNFKLQETPFRLILANDIIDTKEYNSIGLHTGFEFQFLRMLAARFGFQFNDGFSFSNANNSMATGLGIHVKNYQFDYCLKLANNDIAPLEHYFAFVYHF